MRDPRVTRRYATALYDLAVKRGIVERVAEDVQLLVETYRSAPRLADVVESPRIPVERKKAVIDNLFKPRVQPLTLQFAKLLVDRRRFDLLENLLEEFQHLTDRAAGIERARVETAVALTEEQEARLLQRLGALTGKSVMLKMTVDPRIKGGAVVWIGDRMIDGSVASRLAEIERLLSAARPIPGLSEAPTQTGNGRSAGTEQ